VDSNVFITAWDQDYPPSTFPSLWKVLAKHHGDIVLIKPIYDEINSVSDLHMWLMEKSFNETVIDELIEEESLCLEGEYKIDDGPKGANQTDIKLIAYAKIMQKTVVTLEEEQIEKPKKKKNYKIPLICYEQGVKCIRFVEMLNSLGIRI